MQSGRDPLRWTLADHMAHAAQERSRQAGAVRHPPSWSDAAILPAGCCGCCGGWGWWTEAAQPGGWRCMTCHPYPAVPGFQARVVTVADGAGGGGV